MDSTDGKTFRVTDHSLNRAQQHYLCCNEGIAQVNSHALWLDRSTWSKLRIDSIRRVKPGDHFFGKTGEDHSSSSSIVLLGFERRMMQTVNSPLFGMTSPKEKLLKSSWHLSPCGLMGLGKAFVV